MTPWWIFWYDSVWVWIKFLCMTSGTVCLATAQMNNRKSLYFLSICLFLSSALSPSGDALYNMYKAW